MIYGVRTTHPAPLSGVIGHAPFAAKGRVHVSRAGAPEIRGARSPSGRCVRRGRTRHHGTGGPADREMRRRRPAPPTRRTRSGCCASSRTRAWRWSPTTARRTGFWPGSSTREPGRSVSVYGTDTSTDPEAAKRLVGVGCGDLSTAEEPVHEALLTAGRDRGLSREAAVQRTGDLTERPRPARGRARPARGPLPGQRSRAALGCALLHVPKLLLLCRPLDGVDSASEQIICRVLSRYTASTGTVVFSTRTRHTAHRMVVDRLFAAHDDEVCFGCRTAPS